MKEELIQFETAKLAKEAGFDWATLCYYPPHSRSAIRDDIECPCTAHGIYPAPTQSLVQRWLREEHGIDIYVCRSWAINPSYDYSIRQVSTGFLKEQRTETNRTYEQSLEDGLIEALKIIRYE